MPLKNYTTKISAARTVGEIQETLAKMGAKQILMDLDNGVPTGVSFGIDTIFGERYFNLPANVEGVLAVMVRQNKKGQIENYLATREQAVRVAWRTVQDWLEAQLAILETGMVTTAEVFLPYLIGEGGKTMYELMVAKQLALPEGKKDA